MNKLQRLSRSTLPIFDLVARPVLIFSRESLHIRAFNAAAQEWLGYDTNEIETCTILDIRPADEQRELQQRLKEHSFEPAPADIWTIFAKSGERYRARITWRDVSFEGSPACLATVLDVTKDQDIIAGNRLLSASVDDLGPRAALAEGAYQNLFDSAPGKMVALRPGDYEIVAMTHEYAISTMVDAAPIYARKLFEAFDEPDEPGSAGVRNLRASLQRVEAFGITDIMDVQRYPIRQADGVSEERFWLSVNKPVFDSSGELIYIIHRVEDVSDHIRGADMKGAGDPSADMPQLDIRVRQKRLKAEVNSSQERDARLRIAEKFLELGSWECEFSSRKLHWSPRVFEIFGLPLEEGTPDFGGYIDMVHPDDRQRLIDVFHDFEHADDLYMVFQHRLVRSDGAISHIKAVGQRHRIDGRNVVLGFVQDVSEVAEAQVGLPDLAHLQRIAGRAARLGGWRINLHTNQVTWTPDLAVILQQPGPPSPGAQDDLEYHVPEHRDLLYNAVAACRENGQPFDELLHILAPNGKRIWIRAIGEAVRDPDGSIIALGGACQDISDLIAARTEADVLSHRLQQTLESISDGFCLLDDKWRITFLNDRAAALMQRDRNEILGQVLWDQFPETVGSIIQQQCERAVDLHERVRFQSYIAPLETWFELDAHPTPEGLAVYSRDITEKRKRTEQLRLLEAAVSRQNDILLITEAGPITGPDGPKIVYVNDAFVSQTGYSREEAIGQTPRILQGPNTQRSELHKIREALENWRPVRSELINYTKSGEEFWLELDIVPIADESGWYTHWVSIQRDITDRKRAESSIRLNEERFRLLAKATNDVVWDWNLRTDTLWWNENVRSLFGYTPKMIGTGPAFRTEHIHVEDKDRVLESIRNILDGSALSWTSEYRFMHADGHPINVVDRGFVIRNRQGMAVRMLGSMADVTEQREIESKARQSHKLESLGQLTGGIAHDFNNLLTIILGNAEILSEDLNDNAELLALAEMTATAAERGAELINRLLAFAKQQPLEPSLLNANRLIGNMESLLRRTLGEHIGIEVILARGLWLTEVDSSQLENAILNLALNARDAMRDGGSITIETANAAVSADDMAATQDVDAREYIAITVTDTGSGIPHNIRDRIFEPFFTTKEAGQGSGLGLSMVYGFVEQSGGYIRVDSREGEGSSINLYFPRSIRKRITKPDKKNIRRLIGGNECILVVEDYSLVRDHIINQLHRLGYRTIAANGGQEALNILKTTTDVDLLLSDIVMPGIINGIKLADLASSLRPGLKILLTSGYTEKVPSDNGRRDWRIHLLTKPYRREQLAAKVRDVLDGT